MRFAYTCGQKPLVGYTIKRGVARGGFGEVYFGLSDGGKEVALKCLLRNQDIELRGVRQCLNLKHPHLVHLYDVRKDDEGHDWLVMEFVRGETLHGVLQRHPQGLGHDLVVQWFGQIADAVHALHEQGIIHRDLKPANVFLENGQVKVGDYGLCKFTSASQHRSHTQNVGTVHYMSPEVGKGNYTRAVDVYAAGILLYEMVTGRVPFEGETTAEILLKHLSAEPDVTGTGVFAPVIRRALEKDPANRFATLAEMSHRVAHAAAPRPAPAVPVAAKATHVPASTLMTTVTPAPLPARTTVLLPDPAGVGMVPALFRAACLTIVLSLVWVLAFLRQTDLARAAPTFFLTMAGTFGLIAVGRTWRATCEDSLPRRLAQGLLGAALGVFAVWLQGYTLPGLESPVSAGEPARHPFYGALYADNRSLPVLAGHVSYFGLMYLVLRWWRITEPCRPSRFTPAAVLATAFWAFVLLFLLPSAEERQFGFAAMVLTAVVVQFASPWQRATLESPPRKLRLRYA